MSNRTRVLIALLIGLVPLNALRRLLYRAVFRFRIAPGARIGFGTILAPEKATIGRARIGRFNRFLGPFSLEIEDGATIGPSNTFECLFGIAAPQFRVFKLGRYCRIGANSTVTTAHFVDTTAGFDLGRESWIAGRDSQFWTHGAHVPGPISIGSGSYVGSAVRFAPGAAIGSHCIVALGSVVTKRFEDEYLMIAGVPAEILRRGYDWIRRRSITDCDLTPTHTSVDGQEGTPYDPPQVRDQNPKASLSEREP